MLLSGGTCADEYLLVSSEDAIDTVPVNETEVRWFTVDPGSGGPLVLTANEVESARYSITDQHRAYLFGPDITGFRNFGGNLIRGAVSGDKFVQLPQIFAGGESDFAMPTSELASARVYDVGRCSTMIRWNVLANLFALAMNSQLDDVPYSDPLTFQSLSIEPRVAVVPREPAAMPLGLVEGDDGLWVTATYSTESIGGCNGNPTLTISAELAVRSADPIVFTELTAAADLAVEGAGIGCAVDSDPQYWRCTVLTSIDPDGTANTDTFFIYRDPVYDHLLEDVRCVPDGLAYRCEVPHYEFDDEITMANLLVEMSTVRIPGRPTATIANGQAVALEYVSSHVGISGSCVGNLFVGGLNARIELAIARANQVLGEQIATFLGDELEEDYGLSLGSIPECGPPGTDEHFSCYANPSIPYGYQHVCTNDASDSQWRCNGARIDFRRVHVRPEGIELVLAEDEDDPQFSIMDGLPGLIPVGSPAEPALGSDPPRCDSARYGIPDDGLVSVVVNTIAPGAVNPLLIPAVQICDADATGCLGICAEFGTTCGRADSLELTTDALTGHCDSGRCRRSP